MLNSQSSHPLPKSLLVPHTRVLSPGRMRSPVASDQGVCPYEIPPSAPVGGRIGGGKISVGHTFRSTYNSPPACGSNTFVVCRAVGKLSVSDGYARVGNRRCAMREAPTRDCEPAPFFAFVNTPHTRVLSLTRLALVSTPDCSETHTRVL